MSLNFECANCQAIFNERQAKCENWRFKERSFGCPRCGAFLEKGEYPFELKSTHGILLVIDIVGLILAVATDSIIVDWILGAAFIATLLLFIFDADYRKSWFAPRPSKVLSLD